MTPLEVLLWVIVTAAAFELLLFAAGVVFVCYLIWRTR